MPSTERYGSVTTDIWTFTIMSSHSETLKFAVKWLLCLKIFFACGALKGASPLGVSYTAQNRLP